MNRFFALAILVALLAVPALGQQSDSTATLPSPESEYATRVFYGGTVGFSFGSTFRISVQPMVGLVFTPKLSGGIKLGYEYVRQEANGFTTTWNNYGASVFGRYRFIPRVYFHAEFAYASYGYKVGNYTSDRYWVPFLLLGGGYIQPISRTASAFVEVLFDVLQDSNSPYEQWTPWVSFGVSVGF
jgi:hypothetical protein